MLSHALLRYNLPGWLIRCLRFFDVLLILCYFSCHSFVELPLALLGTSFRPFVLYSFFGHSLSTCSPFTLSTLPTTTLLTASSIALSAIAAVGFQSFYQPRCRPLPATTVTPLPTRFLSSHSLKRPSFFSHYGSVFSQSFHFDCPSFNTKSLIYARHTQRTGGLSHSYSWIYALRRGRSLIVLSLIDICFWSCTLWCFFYHTFF